MTNRDKINKMRAIFDKALELAKSKSHDYSGDEDSMLNFRTFGWKGIVVRLSDKIQRLIQFSKSETFKVKEESLEDTLLDIINYAALTLIMYRLENPTTAGSSDGADCCGTPDQCKSSASKIRDIMVKLTKLNPASAEYAALLQQADVLRPGDAYSSVFGKAYTARMKDVVKKIDDMIDNEFIKSVYGPRRVTPTRFFPYTARTGLPT